MIKYINRAKIYFLKLEKTTTKFFYYLKFHVKQSSGNDVTI